MAKDTAIAILFDDSGSLRKLASLSGFEAFSFYNGAALNGLHLKGQDLRGLNFDGADLRGANLEGVQFDPGAFNGAKLSSYAEALKDSFEFYIEDIALITFAGIYFYSRFRPESLEDAIKNTGLTYDKFGTEAKLNLQTLRKARRGQIVSCETAFQISISLARLSRQLGKPVPHQYQLFDGQKPPKAKVTAKQQPLVELLTLRPGGRFEIIDRNELFDFLEGDGRITAVTEIAEIQNVFVRGSDRNTRYAWSNDIFF